MNKHHEYKQKHWTFSFFYLDMHSSNKDFQHCDLMLLKCEFHKLSVSISVPWNFRIFNATDTIIWWYEPCKWNFILQLFNHHIKRWIMLKLKMFLWIEVQIWKERGLQGNCVLVKNIRNCRKKLSTIRENKMRLDSI